MRRPEDALPDLVLERYRLGELSADEVEALRQRLLEEPELRVRLEDLEASDAEIRHRYPPAWLAERIRSRLPVATPATRGQRPGMARRWAVPVAVVATAGLLLVVAPWLGVRPPPGVGVPRPIEERSGDHIKGLEPRLEIFLKTAEGSEGLTDGAVVGVGDVIRVGYRAAGRGFGVILSVDGRGAVTVHLPVAGERAAALAPGELVLLDHAYELDDAPRFERFFLVTGEVPFAVAPVVSAARQLGATTNPTGLRLAAPLKQTTFLLRKGGRP